MSVKKENPKFEVPKFEIPEFKVPKPIDLNKLKYETINRLIIVGNGFDLAHGLKSSFKDFIYDYIKNILIEVETYRSYEDQLVKLKLDTLNIEPGWVIRSLEKKDTLRLLNLVSEPPNGKIEWTSRFFKLLIKEVETKNWVDIEVTYFDLLKDAVTLKDMDLVHTLNEELNFIKDKLVNYLKRVQEEVISDVNMGLLNQFKEKIKMSETLSGTIDGDRFPKHFYFLNFNYTNILHKYFDKMSLNSSTINYIHGCLRPIGGCGGTPIFGFGDEFDEQYITFEKQRNNMLFEHIKSFKYLENSNYRNLMDFIYSNPFQVHLYGHSCGISDRTMLNTIFENENCISVKQFYHDKGNGVNDFTTKNYSISRHFTSKSMLRNKVVNFEYCTPMVQPGD